MPLSFYFVGHAGVEKLKIVFEQRDKIFLASRKTGYKMVDVSNQFYDSAEEKESCLAMSEEEFKTSIVVSFARQGYKLFQIKND